MQQWIARAISSYFHLRASSLAPLEFYKNHPQNMLWIMQDRYYFCTINSLNKILLITQSVPGLGPLWIQSQVLEGSSWPSKGDQLKNPYLFTGGGDRTLTPSSGSLSDRWG